MATVASTSVTEIPHGYNEQLHAIYQASVAAAAAADNVTITLPASWQGKGFTIVDCHAEKFAAAAVGARTRTAVAISVVSHVEATGVVTLLVGAVALDGVGGNRVYITVAPAT